MSRLAATAAVDALKAAAEPTRLRILMLLAVGELNVSDLTRVLGQSQPRISRHLKLLTEAHLVERFREGSWVYFRLAGQGPTEALVRHLVVSLDRDDAVLARDRLRAGEILAERQVAAQAYFRDHAADWDRIRAMHIAEEEVEAAITEAVGPGSFDLVVDLGTGTGRMLELFADRSRRCIGIDASHAMLAYARSRLERRGLTNAQARHGDIYSLALDSGRADLVLMHQVLHFLAEPQRAIREAARLLAPGGRLLIVDFAPHEVELLRERFRHERLGFARQQMAGWIADAGLVATIVRELPPPAGEGEKLNVTLWVGEASAVSGTLAVSPADRDSAERRVA
jgi:ArsR family transcriptional regulator